MVRSGMGGVEADWVSAGWVIVTASPPASMPQHFQKQPAGQAGSASSRDALLDADAATNKN
jgi:hypothetical protein